MLQITVTKSIFNTLKKRNGYLFTCVMYIFILQIIDETNKIPLFSAEDESAHKKSPVEMYEFIFLLSASQTQYCICSTS